MNLIGSVNIQYATDKTGVTLLSFSKPKSNKEAMEETIKQIGFDTGYKKIDVQRSPIQYAKDWQYTAWNHTKHIGWICFNEVTVKG